MNDQNAAILGIGLIGSSVGMALRAAGWHVSGWDADAAALAVAHEREAIDTPLEGPGVGDAGLVVVAAPPAATIGMLERLETEALVTDVAGVKAPIVAAAGGLSHFVGGHPMAGRAGSGPQNATPNLFQGASWIVTSDGAADADIERVSEVVAGLGAHPVVMSAVDHDRAVAAISHLPHVLAAALLEMAASDPRAFDLASGSFRDLTRVAASDSVAWTELLAANAGDVVGAIEQLQSELSWWKEALTGDDDIGERLGAARAHRERLTAEADAVLVPLRDEPGELARVGRALERSGADVRDIQLRHGEHGGGGILTLAVHPRDVDPLRAGLAAEGFEPEG